MSPGVLHRSPGAAYQARRREQAAAIGNCITCCTRKARPDRKRCDHCSGLLAKQDARRDRSDYNAAVYQQRKNRDRFLVCCAAFGGHRVGCGEERT